MISQGIVRMLESVGPLSVEEISVRMSIPSGHVRAAVCELAYRDRRVCSDGRRITLGAPPDSWPTMKRFVD